MKVWTSFCSILFSLLYFFFPPLILYFFIFKTNKLVAGLTFQGPPKKNQQTGGGPDFSRDLWDGSIKQIFHKLLLLSLMEKIITLKMETYLEALDLWEAMKEDYEVPLLPNNPTMIQIKNHKERSESQRGKHVYLLLSQQPFSQESCLSK